MFKEWEIVQSLSFDIYQVLEKMMTLPLWENKSGYVLGQCFYNILVCWKNSWNLNFSYIYLVFKWMFWLELSN